jgi:hypothetical protein
MNAAKLIGRKTELEAGEMAPSNAELACRVLDLIHAQRGHKATSPDDPILDEVVVLIEQGIKRRGFASELLRQASAAGMKLDARLTADLLIVAARNTAKSDCKTSDE